MVARLHTQTPQGLLNKFNSAIAQVEPKGKITTWEKNSQGYYTHKASEWRHKAFFEAKVESGNLSFYIIRPKDSKISPVVYGYYHGHLIETFLNHFDKDFTTGAASAMPVTGELV